MESSKLGYPTWAIATFSYPPASSLSSMKLHRERSARFLADRLREALADRQEAFEGPVKVDEAYSGRLRKNMLKALAEEGAGRGAVGKTAVVGAKDRKINAVRAKAVQGTDKATLQGVVRETAAEGATLYANEHGFYAGMPEYEQKTFNHPAGEYVRGMVHTNGVESFWSMLKQAYKRIFHKFSPNNLRRYVDEFSDRQNVRETCKIDIVAVFVAGAKGKHLHCRRLISGNGLPSGVQS